LKPPLFLGGSVREYDLSWQRRITKGRYKCSSLTNWRKTNFIGGFHHFFGENQILLAKFTVLLAKT
jgi:hypothetical protein